MNVITSFNEKRYEKQLKFERKLLRDISLKPIKENVDQVFSSFFYSNYIYATAIEDAAIDIAVEAYLLGARMSRFGYYGESSEQVRKRSYLDEKEFIDTLYEYLKYWGAGSRNDFEGESLYIACTTFVEHWWMDGFLKGEKRHRLRLH